MSTEDNIGKIFKLNETDNILNMSSQVNACIQEVMPLGQASQRGSVDAVPSFAKLLRHSFPGPPAAPSAMN